MEGQLLITSAGRFFFYLLLRTVNKMIDEGCFIYSLLC